MEQKGEKKSASEANFDFRVPNEARWSPLKAKAPQPAIGQLIDEAMAASIR